MGQRQSQVDDNVLREISKFSDISPELIDSWNDRFSQHCRPGTNQLNEMEFCRFYREIRANENVESLSKNIFRAFDLNGDRGICFSEFVIGHFSTSDAALEEKLRYAFEVYDIDGSRRIDMAEIRFILRAMFELLGMNSSSTNYSVEQCAEMIMKNLDVNHDRLLSREEFIEGLKTDPFLLSLMNPFQPI